MPIEQYANGAATTLATLALTSGASSLDVASSSGFPPTGNFRILLGTELILVTAVSGITWTIVRGVEGTTAASHVLGDAITHTLTTGSLLKVLDDGITRDILSNRYVAGRAGRLYLPTDGNGQVYQDNGTNWSAIGPVFPLVPPDPTQFSWVNQGSAVLDSSHGAMNLTSPASTGNLRMLVKALPGAAPYTIKACLLQMSSFVNFCNLGLVLYDSGSGKVITFNLGFNTFVATDGPVINVEYWNSTTSLNGGASISRNINWGLWFKGPQFMRMVDDGTTRSYQLSADGQQWTTYWSEADTTWITPTHAGIYVNPENGTYDAGLTLLSWED